MTDHSTHFFGDGCDPPHGCERCHKPSPPYMAAVPSEFEDEYCWGTHDVDDLRAEVARLTAIAGITADPEWIADVHERLRRAQEQCDEIARLQAIIDAVRALHVRYDARRRSECAHCDPLMGWPCPTVEALDGDGP